MAIFRRIASHLTEKKKIYSRFGHLAMVRRGRGRGRPHGDSDLIGAPLETHRRTMLAPNVNGASLVQRAISDCHIRCPTLPVIIPFPEGVRNAIAVCHIVRHPKNRENNTDLENDTLKNGGLLCQVSAKPSVSEEVVVEGIRTASGI